MVIFGIPFLVTGKLIGIIIGLAGAGFVYKRYIQPLLQTELKLDNDTISGQINGDIVHLFWRNILVARQTGDD